jgi:hypothetical protein
MIRFVHASSSQARALLSKEPRAIGQSYLFGEFALSGNPPLIKFSMS